MLLASSQMKTYCIILDGKSEKSIKKGLKGLGQKVSNLFTKLVLSEPAAPIEIGTPYNVQHVQHVQPDPHSSTGFSVSIDG